MAETMRDDTFAAFKQALENLGDDRAALAAEAIRDTCSDTEIEDIITELGGELAEPE